MRPPGRWHRRGKRVCLVGAVVCGVAMVLSFVGQFSVDVVSRPSDSNQLGYRGVSAFIGGRSVHVRCSRGWQAAQIWWTYAGTGKTLGERLLLNSSVDWGYQGEAFRFADLFPGIEVQPGAFVAYMLPVHPLAIFGGIYLALHHRDRRWRRLTSNACPKCKYPLTGLKPDALCPECGAGRAKG